MPAKLCSACGSNKAALRRAASGSLVLPSLSCHAEPLCGLPTGCCFVAREQLQACSVLAQFCRTCFFTAFEDEVYDTIVKEGLLLRGERIAVGASGGKDSTVLAHVLTTLNKRHK